MLFNTPGGRSLADNGSEWEAVVAEKCYTVTFKEAGQSAPESVTQTYQLRH